MKKFAIGKLMGGCGNQFYQTATVIAYAIENDFDYAVTPTSVGCGTLYFSKFDKRDISAEMFEERYHADGRAVFSLLPPKMENVMLVGFWQSFEYFNRYRREVLDAFALPYQKKEVVSIYHCPKWLGDDDTDSLPLEYYKKAIGHFNEIGIDKFIVFSNNIEASKKVFTAEFFKDYDTEFQFSDNRTPLEDLVEMSCCEHNIVGNDTYSYAASWLNQNEDKIVVSPAEKYFPSNRNDMMIPDDYIQISF